MYSKLATDGDLEAFRASPPGEATRVLAEAVLAQWSAAVEGGLFVAYDNRVGVYEPESGRFVPVVAAAVASEYLRIDPEHRRVSCVAAGRELSPTHTCRRRLSLSSRSLSRAYH